MSRVRGAAVILAVTLGSLHAPLSVAAQPPAGPIDNPEVARVGGGRQPLLASGYTALVFVRAGQSSSRAGLLTLGRAAQALGPKVKWVAVLSDRFTPEEQREVSADAGAIPVVLDPGDRLYARLNIALHPTVALIDPRRRALFLHPFSKLEFGPFAEAKIRHALGELDDDQLRKALDPDGAASGSAAAPPMRSAATPPSPRDVTPTARGLRR